MRDGPLILDQLFGIHFRLESKMTHFNLRVENIILLPLDVIMVCVFWYQYQLVLHFHIGLPIRWMNLYCTGMFLMSSVTGHPTLRERSSRKPVVVLEYVLTILLCDVLVTLATVTSM